MTISKNLYRKRWHYFLADNCFAFETQNVRLSNRSKDLEAATVALCSTTTRKFQIVPVWGLTIVNRFSTITWNRTWKSLHKPLASLAAIFGKHWFSHWLYSSKVNCAWWLYSSKVTVHTYTLLTLISQS